MPVRKESYRSLRRSEDLIRRTGVQVFFWINISYILPYYTSHYSILLCYAVLYYVVPRHITLHHVTRVVLRRINIKAYYIVGRNMLYVT